MASKNDFNRGELEKEGIFGPKDKWFVSKWNFKDVVRKGVKFPDRIILKDETIRSGANTPGVYATLEDKIEVAKKLEEAGVQETESGYAAIDADCEFTRRLKREGTTLRLGAHVLTSPNYRDHIDRAIDSGIDIVNIVGGASYVGRSTFWGKTGTEGTAREKVPELVYNCVKYSKDRGMFTAWGMNQTTREWMEKCYTAACEAGADRIYVYDGKGWLLPETVSYLFRYVKDIVGPKQLAFHAHDDFGLATMNSLEAIKAGAEVVDTVVNALGHRSGNAAFEQVASILIVLYGVDIGIRLEKIYEVCKLVEKLYDLKIPSNAKVVGENVYLHGGAHVRALLTGNWYEWETIRAETLGMKRQLIFGPTSLKRGRDAEIPLKIEKMGLEYTDEHLDKIFVKLQELIKKKKIATEEEVEQIIREVVSN